MFADFIACNLLVFDGLQADSIKDGNAQNKLVDNLCSSLLNTLLPPVTCLIYLVSKHAVNKRIYVFYWSCFDTKYIKQVTGGSKVLSNEEQRFSRQKYWRGVMHAVIEEERSKAQEGREDA
jgi:hypothetical protein